MTKPSLDDLYRMVAHIYSEQNIARSIASTFSHFVEVCGMLTIHDRKKRREGVSVTDALCKALGWYFPLLAKMRIRSVEEIIYRKFPYACPYCRQVPHKDAICKLVRGTSSTVSHAEVHELYQRNAGRRPKGLDEWQHMFQEIYPRESDDRGRSTIGLLEEIGELAEAIRVYDKHPKYFIGEAADAFSYLMGIANEHALRLKQDQDIDFSFEHEFLLRYPGLCVQCGSRVCVCPSIPEATVGRLAKELDIRPNDDLFVSDPENFSREGEGASQRVFELAGGYAGLTSKLPFDRGDANHALLQLCLLVASAVEAQRPEFSAKLRAEAVRISTSAAYPGSKATAFDATSIISQLSQVWRELDGSVRKTIKSGSELIGELGDSMETIRILMVACSPVDAEALQVNREARIVKEATQRNTKANRLDLTILPAATSDDLRRALLDKPYEIVHFAGHANSTHLIFEKEDGRSAEIPLSALASLIERYPSVKCVILNGCESTSEISAPISPITIGMEAEIQDEASVEFARGFYDALAAGKSVEFAYSEGVSAVRLRGLDHSPIRILSRDSAGSQP